MERKHGHSTAREPTSARETTKPGAVAMGIGRVVDPGSDNVVRTATVKTVKGIFVRPLSKLAILPIET